MLSPARSCGGSGRASKGLFTCIDAPLVLFLHWNFRSFSSMAKCIATVSAINSKQYRMLSCQHILFVGLGKNLLQPTIRQRGNSKTADDSCLSWRVRLPFKTGAADEESNQLY